MSPQRILSFFVFFGVLIFITLFAFLFAGCGFTEYKNGAPTQGPLQSPAQSGAPPTSGGTTATFSEVNTQILQAKCISCHGSGSSPDFSSYGSFATNTSFIVAGNPASSAVYNAVQSGAMPQGGPALTSAEVGLIYDWIQAGALND